MWAPNFQALESEYATFRRRVVNGIRFDQLRFSIMHGNGNVLLILDEMLSDLSPEHVNSALARDICQSFDFVRIDGISFLRTTGEPVRMTYFERDGTHSEMCGNGLRCSALYSYEQGYISSEDVIATDDGEKWVSTAGPSVRAGLGSGREFGRVAEDRYFVFSGLPHLVVLVSDLESVDVKKLGSTLRYDDALCRRLNHPEGIHVDFMEAGPGEVSIRTYEVGVEDETLACGTGAAGAAFVANRVWRLPFPMRVMTKGGEMAIDENAHGLVISGEIEYLFSNIKAEVGA